MTIYSVYWGPKVRAWRDPKPPSTGPASCYSTMELNLIFVPISNCVVEIASPVYQSYLRVVAHRDLVSGARRVSKLFLTTWASKVSGIKSRLGLEGWRSRSRLSCPL